MFRPDIILFLLYTEKNYCVIDWHVYIYVLKHFGMENIKFIAGQARSINLYKNTRSKLLKCCANVCFKKQYFAKRVISSYASIKFPNTSPLAQST